MTRCELTRRHAVTGAALGLAGVGSACGGDTGGDGGDTEPSGTPSASPDDPTDSSSPTGGSAQSGGEEAETGTPEQPAAEGVVAAADVPVGGGVVLADENLVVTQPEKGSFKAFDATCTHQGCQVGSVGETIDCPCHGSSFSITDGSVARGPAPAALPERRVRVRNGQVLLG